MYYFRFENKVLFQRSDDAQWIIECMYYSPYALFLSSRTNDENQSMSVCNVGNMLHSKWELSCAKEGTYLLQNVKVNKVI